MTKKTPLSLMAFLIITSVFFLTLSHRASALPKIEFTDMNQRQIVLKKPAERIVVIPIPAASMLISLDASSKRLIGMHPTAKIATQEGILSTMFPETIAIHSDTVGQNFTPNIETLLNVKPDLVWQWGHRGNDIIEPIENAGLTVATLLYGKEEYTQTWIRLFGDMLGQQDKAQKMLEWRLNTIDELKKITKNIPEASKPKVLYLSRFLNEFQTFGSSSHNNADFALAGGFSLNADLTGSRTINAEQILAWDPDIILLGNFETKGTPNDIYHHPYLGDVTAVKNHRVYKLPLGGFFWDAPNQETPLYWKWLYRVFYPQNNAESLRTEIQNAYQHMYGYHLSSEQIDGILQMELNRNSANYLTLFSAHEKP